MVKKKFTLTGPGEAEQTDENRSSLVSLAITFATRSKHKEATFYVRDASDNVVTRVEREADGSLNVIRVQA